MYRSTRAAGGWWLGGTLMQCSVRARVCWRKVSNLNAQRFENRVQKIALVTVAQFNAFNYTCIYVCVYMHYVNSLPLPRPASDRACP